MKQITISKVEVKEIIILQEKEIALSVLYILKDENDVPVMNKRVTVKKDDLPKVAQVVLADLVSKIEKRIEDLEL